MKSRFILMSFLVLLLCSASVSAASISGNTVTAANPQAAAALVYVSGYDLTPGVFYPGETGTVTVHVTNAANTSVSYGPTDPYRSAYPGCQSEFIHDRHNSWTGNDHGF